MSNLSPIILFTYNRLEHTKKTINALLKNHLAKQSELFIYSDGAKNKHELQKVNEVREYLHNIKGFKSLTIIKREENFGLAANIIDGVSAIINKYNKAIILEDDIVTNPYFLNFMNDSLNFYENIKKVWHISGWNYPINNENLNETFLWRTMNCWGWATWKDRWEKYEKNPQKLIDSFSSKEISKFNLDDSVNFWEQVIKNNKKQMNTWAIFWYASIFKNNGLCLNPSKSFVENIGFDGTGTNTGKRKNYSNNISSNTYNITFEKNLIENRTATDRIKLFFREKNNPNLTFSKNLNRLISLCNEIKEQKENIIIYGSGTGFELVKNFLENKIEFIIDKDETKNNTYKNNLKIYSLNYFNNIDSNNLKILISVFGREEEIVNTLIKNFNISKERIITINFF